MTTGSLILMKYIAGCSLGAFCNIFELHSAIIGVENYFGSFLRVDISNSSLVAVR